MRSLSTKRVVAAVLILGLALAPAAWASPRAESSLAWAGVWARVWGWVVERAVGGEKVGPGIHGDGLAEGPGISPDGAAGAGFDNTDEGPGLVSDG